MKSRAVITLLTTTIIAVSVNSPTFARGQADGQAVPDASGGDAPIVTQPEAPATVPVAATQGTPAQAAGDIVITGTRIPQPNLTSASPVTVLSSQEVKLSGTTRTEDLINSLPQAFASQGSNISNGSTGTASVNLRGIGSSRTLVLVNGRRLQPGDPRNPVADINFIPASIIKRVDVLTGGASSVYGADAVAGVVNFILDTNFTGLRIDAQASTFTHYNNTNSGILAANTGADRGTTTDAGPLSAFNYQPPHGQSTNGGAQDISAAFGASFDENRGHVTAYATYRKQDPVLQASRDYSFCTLGGLVQFDPRPARFPGDRPSVDRTGRNFNCGGSATSANGTIFTNVGTFQVGGAGGNQFIAGSTPFNFGPFNYYQRPDERYTFGSFADYEISPVAHPYLEAMFMDDRSVAQIAPSGDFFNTKSINCDNPLLSAQQLAAICVPGNTFVDAQGVTRAVAYVGRRNVEGGPRQDNTEHLDYRIVGGVKGEVQRGISYDAYYQFGTTRFNQSFANDFSITRLNRALDVVANPATGGVAGVAAGTPVCRSALPGTGPGGTALDASCVPYNIFRTGGVTPQALGYLQVPLLSRGNVNETIADANVTIEGSEYGIQTPWADRGVGLNVGAEYRKEALNFQVDSEFQSGDGAGQGGATLPVSGSFDVRELFAEFQVPIVEHSFIDEFTLTGGYRYSDYKVAGRHFSTDTYKLDARLAPIPDILFRGSYNRAVRAPNVVEQFSPGNVALGGSADPCAGAAVGGLVNGFTAAQCANSGVSAAQFGNINPNPANQYNAFFSGNTNLSPETADTYTAGVLLKPRFIPGLSLSADYYDIKVKNLVGVIPYQAILQNCITTANPVTCGAIHRAAGSGSLWLSPTGFVDQITTNIGGLRTKGIDVNAAYSRKVFGLGTLNVSLVGTYLKNLITDTGLRPNSTFAGSALDGKFDCANFYGTTCGTPNSKWRHTLRTGFTLANGLGISGRWRYFGKVKFDARSSDCDLGTNVAAHAPPFGGTGSPTAVPAHCGIATTDNNFIPGDSKISAQSYFDLALSARITDKYNFRLGVNNILDKEPPVVGSEAASPPFANGNTYPQVYDALGRFMFAGVTIDL